MKILSEDSPLVNLPIEINEHRFLVFDAIRTSFEIIEFSFAELEYRLDILSNSKKVEVAVIFHYVWSIIDYTEKVNGLVRQLKIEKLIEFLKIFEGLKDLRNTFQHMNNRSKMIISKNSPLYGVLIWFYKDLETGCFTPYSLISGIAYSKINLEFSVPNLEDSQKSINFISLRSISDGTARNVVINEIMNDLKRLCILIEEKLKMHCEENQFKMLNWDKRKEILAKYKSSNV